jgi:hypothetical protein
MAARSGFPTERGRKAADKIAARLGTNVTTHVPIDALPEGLFPSTTKVAAPTTKVVGLHAPRGTAKSYVMPRAPERRSVPPKPKHSAFEVLTGEIANDWMRARRDPRVLELLEPQFKRRLEELDRVTRGQPARCFCLTGRDSQGRDHSRECPARKP